MFVCLFLLSFFLWVLWHINLWRLYNVRSIFLQILLFHTIQFSISTRFNCQKCFYYKQIQLIKPLYFKQFSSAYKNCSFQSIQFSISAQFSSIWPIDRTLSGATTLGQSGPGSDSNEGVLCFSQSSSIKQIIDSLASLFLLTHIWPNF